MIIFRVSVLNVIQIMFSLIINVSLKFKIVKLTITQEHAIHVTIIMY
jgi:hypothetical protein